MRIYIIVLIIFCITRVGEVSAQRGYIAKDSTYSQGYLDDQGVFRNNRFISFTQYKNQAAKEYTPYELVEFGFEKGHQYISKEVAENDSTVRYFLLNLVDNKGAKLFLLKTVDGDRFFADVDGSFTELYRETYRGQLKSVFTKFDYSDQIESAKFNINSLARLFKLYNAGYTGFNPGFRVGVSAGVINQQMKIKSLENTASLTADPTLAAGVVVDFPFIANSKWFVNINLLYQKNSYSMTEKDDEATFDHLVKTSALTLPIAWKYSTSSKNLRCFMKAGPIITFLLQREYVVYRAVEEPPTVLITRHDLNNLGSMQVGVLAGAGLEYSLNLKYAIGIEARYSYEGAPTNGQNHVTSTLGFSTYFLFSK